MKPLKRLFFACLLLSSPGFAETLATIEVMLPRANHLYVPAKLQELDSLNAKPQTFSLVEVNGREKNRFPCK